MQPGELGSGRHLLKTDILLVLQACIINKASLTWHVQYETATGDGGSFWVWPKSYSWKQEGSYLCSSSLTQLEAMCNMSLPAYPPVLQKKPRLHTLDLLSFSSVTAASRPQQVLFHRGYNK